MKPKTPTEEGRVLAAVREAKGKDQKVLAADFGVRPSLISDYERGKKALSRGRLEELLATLGCAPAAIGLTVAWMAELPPLKREGEEESPEEEVARVVAEALAALVRVARPVFVKAARDAQARRKRAEAVGLVEVLEKATWKEAKVLVEKDPAFQTWAVCEGLCAASERAAPASAKRAVRLARLATIVADVARDAEGWRPLLQAYAAAFLGNAGRVAGDLNAADRAFAACRRRLEEPVIEDPGFLDMSRLLDLEASLRRAQERFPAARDLLDQALAQVMDEAAAGRIWLKKSAVLEQAGDPAGALAALREAAGRVDGSREPRLLFGTKFNLAATLLRAGQTGEAESLLAEVREAAESLRNHLDLERLRWLEGRVAAARGRLEEAAEALGDAHLAFRNEGIAYDTAMTGLHLAEVYLRLGQTVAVRELARSSYVALAEQDAPESAHSAWTVFFQAALQETVTLELVQKLARELEQSGRGLL